MPSFFRKVSNLFMSNFVECKAGKQFQKKWKISLKFVHHAYNSVNRVNTLSRYLPVMIYHTKTDLGSMTKFLPKIPQLHYNIFLTSSLWRRICTKCHLSHKITARSSQQTSYHIIALQSVNFLLYFVLTTVV